MEENFLIGTYTKKDSKGVYAVTLDDDAGKLSNVRLAIPSQKPAYLQVGSNDRVYAIKQIDDQGGVASYSLKDDNAKMLSKVLAAGAPPAYVGLDRERHLLYSANYHTAKVDVFRINEDGTLTQTDSVTHQGATGPRPEQEAPHVHFADLTPDKRLVVCDLGMDLIVIYDVSADGKLTEDIGFSSPSAAAGFVSYSSVNGLIAWVSDDGKTLKDLENNSLTEEIAYV